MPNSIGNNVRIPWRDLITLGVMLTAIIGSYVSLRFEVKRVQDGLLVTRNELKSARREIENLRSVTYIHAGLEGHPVMVERVNQLRYIHGLMLNR